MRRNLLTYLIASLVVSFGGLLAVLLTGTNVALGLDLQGGISVTMQAQGEFTREGLQLARDRIEERIDRLGVAEPEILIQGDDAIVVNLPGVDDQEEALRLVQVTGQVYLRPVLRCTAPVDPTATTTTTSTTEPGATSTEAGTSTTVAGATTAAPTTAAPGPARERSAPTSTDAPATTVTGSTTSTDPGPTTTVPATTTTTTRPVSDPTITQVLPTRDGAYCEVGPAGGTGEVFKDDAKASILGAGGWGVTVGLRGGSDGVGLWNQLAVQCYNATAVCPTRQLAIELDGEIVSYPVVQEPTFTNEVSITGSFGESEAKDLATVLRSGALPVRLETQAIANVSPTLGEDSLRAAVVSGLVGVFLVFAFMVAYYRHLGLVVFGGIAVSGALTWTIVSLLSSTVGLTLSLAGITGIIISVGVTVDSYVVFFERLKDEVRSGRTMRNSAQRGFAAAWRTILVADLVSLMGAAVLWYLTVGSVRNFAFFLGMSTLCDLVVAYVFIRPAVLLLARTEWMARRKVMGIEAATASSGAHA